MDYCSASATSRVDLQASFSAPKGVTPIQGTVRRASWPGRFAEAPAPNPGFLDGKISHLLFTISCIYQLSIVVNNGQ